MVEREISHNSAVGFRQVNKSFGQLTVFDDLSLNLPKDQITAIVGASDGVDAIFGCGVGAAVVLTTRVLKLR